MSSVKKRKKKHEEIRKS